MDQSDSYFEKLESILDREQADLLQTRREHHSSWDRHILTLSMAAVGFSFTVLPLSGSQLSWLAISGVLAFVVSIAFSAFAFIVADNGLERASESHLARRLQHDQIRHRVNKLKRDMSELKSGDQDAIDRARAQCWADVEQIYAEREPQKEIDALNESNRKVNLLNRFRTYSFLLGIITVTIFSLCNISLFGK